MKKVSMWIVLVTAMIFTAVLRKGAASPTARQRRSHKCGIQRRTLPRKSGCDQ
jgi:hypothetical protein